INVLCTDKTGTLTAGVMRVEGGLDARGEPSARPLTLAALNSVFETGIRSPLDAALASSEAAAAARTFRKVDEIPFDFERRRLSVIVEPPDRPGARLLITKGAAESILPLATACELDGKDTPIDDDLKRQFVAAHDRLSAEGLRVLAVAFRWCETKDVFSRDDERDLVVAGFVTFSDPVLPDVNAVLAQMKSDGVDVKILTGDSELAARHVCG